MRYLVALFVLFAALPSAGTTADPLRILVMGDSFMTSNRSTKASVPHLLTRQLGAKVSSRAVSGARYVYALPITGALGMNISKQWRKGNWDVVVMNGGGNDLWMGCGCGRCNKRLERLISQDGRNGLIPANVARARSVGAKVIYVGYLRSPGRGSLIEGCKVWGDRLETRIARMAKRDRGVRFVSLQDMVPHGDRSFHALDMIHPSPKGSAAATQRIIRAIKQR